MWRWLSTYRCTFLYLVCFSSYCLPVLLKYTAAKPVVSLDNKIKMLLFSNSTAYQSANLDDAVALVRDSPFFNASKPLVLIVHGADMQAFSGTERRIIDALGKHHADEYNILAPDFPGPMKRNSENRFYFGVLNNMEAIAEKIGLFLCELISNGLTTPRKINLVGYSLGGQAVGYIARVVKRKFEPIYYIASLEPAGPGFAAPYRAPWSRRLKHVSRDDALHTHVYHTNCISFGTCAFHRGTADFVFNNGVAQPGCFFGKRACSHARVTEIFAEALEDDDAFVGLACGSFLRFALCRCEGRQLARVGFPPDTGARGIYYVRTRRTSPYGKGADGTECHAKSAWNWILEKVYLSSVETKEDDEELK